jgi:hypothetical protein
MLVFSMQAEEPLQGARYGRQAGLDRRNTLRLSAQGRIPFSLGCSLEVALEPGEIHFPNVGKALRPVVARGRQRHNRVYG